MNRKHPWAFLQNLTSMQALTALYPVSFPGIFSLKGWSNDCRQTTDGQTCSENAPFPTLMSFSWHRTLPDNRALSKSPRVEGRAGPGEWQQHCAETRFVSWMIKSCFLDPASDTFCLHLWNRYALWLLSWMNTIPDPWWPETDIGKAFCPRTELP